MLKLPAHLCKHAWEQKARRVASNEGDIKCLNLACNQAYGVLALFILSTCILVPHTMYCHFLMNFIMQVISKLYLFLPKQAGTEGRNELLILDFLRGAIWGSSPLDICWRKADLFCFNQPKHCITEWSNLCGNRRLCQLGSLGDCFLLTGSKSSGEKRKTNPPTLNHFTELLVHLYNN